MKLIERPEYLELLKSVQGVPDIKVINVKYETYRDFCYIFRIEKDA